MKTNMWQDEIARIEALRGTLTRLLEEFDAQRRPGTLALAGGFEDVGLFNRVASFFKSLARALQSLSRRWSEVPQRRAAQEQAKGWAQALAGELDDLWPLTWHASRGWDVDYLLLDYRLRAETDRFMAALARHGWQAIALLEAAVSEPVAAPQPRPAMVNMASVTRMRPMLTLSAG